VRSSGTDGGLASDDLERLHALQDRIRSSVEPVLGGERVALVNFPNHRNAGDPALWLGAEAVLADVGATVVHRAAWNVDVEQLAARLAPGTVVALGAGGNLGDLYPAGQQRTRELVLERLRDHRVVQLPQSVHFEDPAEAARVAALVAAHGDTVVMCRDTPSLEVVADWGAADVLACPDLSFMVGPLPRLVEPSHDVVWLSRQDPERFHPVPTARPGWLVLDWLAPLEGEGERAPVRGLRARTGARLIGTSRPAPRLGRTVLGARWAASTFVPVATAWVARGLRILQSGRVVITDRLHGHLLAWMSGVPSVVLDNSYGKVHAVVRETTLGSPGVALAGSLAEAEAAAERMLARSAS
jgi:pyruvyl transferase EpsO